MAEIAAQIQTKYGLSLRPDWVQACVNYLQSRSLGAVQESILAQALLSDLNACGAGNLPADLKDFHKGQLQGKHILQVDEVVNMAAPAKERYQGKAEGRCLKLHLTDGVQHVYGIEFRHIPGLSWDIPAGTKVVVENVAVRRGVLLLQQENCRVLGGEVERLEEARRKAVACWNKPAGGRTRDQGPRPVFDESAAAAWQEASATAEEDPGALPAPAQPDAAPGGQARDQGHQPAWQQQAPQQQVQVQHQAPQQQQWQGQQGQQPGMHQPHGQQQGMQQPGMQQLTGQQQGMQQQQAGQHLMQNPGSAAWQPQGGQYSNQGHNHQQYAPHQHHQQQPQHVYQQQQPASSVQQHPPPQQQWQQQQGQQAFPHQGPHGHQQLSSAQGLQGPAQGVGINGGQQGLNRTGSTGMLPVNQQFQQQQQQQQQQGMQFQQQQPQHQGIQQQGYQSTGYQQQGSYQQHNNSGYQQQPTSHQQQPAGYQQQQQPAAGQQASYTQQTAQQRQGHIHGTQQLVGQGPQAGAPGMQWTASKQLPFQQQNTGQAPQQQQGEWQAQQQLQGHYMQQPQVPSEATRTALFPSALNQALAGQPPLQGQAQSIGVLHQAPAVPAQGSHASSEPLSKWHPSIAPGIQHLLSGAEPTAHTGQQQQQPQQPPGQVGTSAPLPVQQGHTTQQVAGHSQAPLQQAKPLCRTSLLPQRKVAKLLQGQAVAPDGGRGARASEVVELLSSDEEEDAGKKGVSTNPPRPQHQQQHPVHPQQAQPIQRQAVTDHPGCGVAAQFGTRVQHETVSACMGSAGTYALDAGRPGGMPPEGTVAAAGKDGDAVQAAADHSHECEYEDAPMDCGFWDDYHNQEDQIAPPQPPSMPGHTEPPPIAGWQDPFMAQQDQGKQGSHAQKRAGSGCELQAERGLQAVGRQAEEVAGMGGTATAAEALQPSDPQLPAAEAAGVAEVVLSDDDELDDDPMVTSVMRAACAVMTFSMPTATPARSQLPPPPSQLEHQPEQTAGQAPGHQLLGYSGSQSPQGEDVHHHGIHAHGQQQQQQGRLLLSGPQPMEVVTPAATPLATLFYPAQLPTVLPPPRTLVPSTVLPKVTPAFPTAMVVDEGGRSQSGVVNQEVPHDTSALGNRHPVSSFGEGRGPAVNRQVPYDTSDPGHGHEVSTFGEGMAAVKEEKEHPQPWLQTVQLKPEASEQVCREQQQRGDVDLQGVQQPTGVSTSCPHPLHPDQPQHSPLHASDVRAASGVSSAAAEVPQVPLKFLCQVAAMLGDQRGAPEIHNHNQHAPQHLVCVLATVYSMLGDKLIIEDPTARMTVHVHEAVLKDLFEGCSLTELLQVPDDPQQQALKHQVLNRGEQKVKAFHGLMTLSLPSGCGDCAGGTHDGGGHGAGGPDVTSGGAQATLVGLATLQGPGRVRAVLGGLRAQWESEHGGY